MKIKAFILMVFFLSLTACVSTVRMAEVYPQPVADVSYAFAFTGVYGYCDAFAPIYFDAEFYGVYPWGYPYYRSTWHYGYPYGYGHGWWYGHRNFPPPIWNYRHGGNHWHPRPQPRPHQGGLGNNGVSPRHSPRIQPVPRPGHRLAPPPVNRQRANPRPPQKQGRPRPHAPMPPSPRKSGNKPHK
jgi:hypothetical protein